MTDWRDTVPGWLRAMHTGDPIRVELTGILQNVGYGQIGLTMGDCVNLTITYGANHDMLFLRLNDQNVHVTPVVDRRRQPAVKADRGD